MAIKSFASTKSEFIKDSREAGFYLGVASRMISVYDSPEGTREVARIAWDKRGVLSFAGTREGDKFRQVISIEHVRSCLNLNHGRLPSAQGGSVADSNEWAWDHSHKPADV
ncbi:hypothetical protein ACWDYH_00350 [Nocardia goodfellowii]